ncbi:hypothetical protein BDZ97DRAFT_1790520 [Flammula alnicola]|nr:hypothetical protein BDZ97DRAFT_1790520 [Flammula alnicola]
MPTTADLGSLTAACHLPSSRLCARRQNCPIATTAMDHPQHSNSPFIPAHKPLAAGYSLAQTFRCQSKIATLRYRLSSLSNFLSSVSEIQEFVSPEKSNFIEYHRQIIILVELARKTLESAGVVPYLWASCPRHLMPHKAAYLDLLRILQSNEQYVDREFQKRLRVLLMPLTSKFSISECRDMDVTKDFNSNSSTQGHIPSSSVRYGLQNYPYPPSEEASSSSMLPPDAFPQTNNRPHTPSSSRKSGDQRLWYRNELHTLPGERRQRSRSPRRRNNSDVQRGQENLAPESVAFQPPPSKQRFGIFLTGKSSMLGNYKRKHRTGRPTH